MKRLVWLIVMFAFNGVLAAQDYDSYLTTDTRAQSIPRSVTGSADLIAAFIKSDFSSDKARVRAAYVWVISNISYDKDSMYHFNCSADNDVKIAATLRRRRGVCENFASLFSALVGKMGIPSFVVHGYTREGGAVSWIGHSWSSVQVDGQWYLCDPTWDAGNIRNTRFFLAEPEDFIQVHMPFDPLWQLIPYPLTNREFANRALYTTANKTIFYFVDSAAAYLALDTLHQLEAASRRMRAAGILNETLRVWNSYYEMKISIIYGEQDMNVYNAAVEDFNKATGIFNDFVAYRNNRFQPLKPDAELSTLLDPINAIISSAYQRADILDQNPRNFQYNPGMLRESLARLERKVEEQKNFLAHYLAAGKPERDKLFYR